MKIAATMKATAVTAENTAVANVADSSTATPAATEEAREVNLLHTTTTGSSLSQLAATAGSSLPAATAGNSPRVATAGNSPRVATTMADATTTTEAGTTTAEAATTTTVGATTTTEAAMTIAAAVITITTARPAAMGYKKAPKNAMMATEIHSMGKLKLS